MILNIKANQNNSISQKVKKFLPFLNLTDGPWVAGGSARLLANDADLGGSDIDVYFPNVELFSWASSFLARNTNTSGRDFQNYYREFKLTDGGEQFTIQLMKKKFYENVDKMFDAFDFTCCLFATDGNEIITNDTALIDADKKRLVLKQVPKKSYSLRLAKYSLKGFTPEPGVLTAMLGLHEEQNYSSLDDDSSY